MAGPTTKRVVLSQKEAAALAAAVAVGSPYLTLAEAAAYCRVAAGTLKNAKCRGKLKAVGFGRRARYTRAELDRWLRDG